MMKHFYTLLLVLLATVSAQAADPVVLTWDYTEKAPGGSPDNGMYYASNVNDAPGSKNGYKGIKLNSSGYAYFEKPAVAGKLTLYYAVRDGVRDYQVDVCRGTLGADGKPVKGDLIATTAATQEMNPTRVDLDADVAGIYICRKTGVEGVLSKVVFKENVPRAFTDFEFDLTGKSADYDLSTLALPAGVTLTGATFHDEQHGYTGATITVPVDGTVRFTIGGCQYGGTAKATTTDGTQKDIDLKAAGCYPNGTATYIYVGPATTITFTGISYLNYFKAEATDVQECVVSYKDQSGKTIAKVNCYEGDPLGAVPAEASESALTIPEGSKFRGWAYANKKKIHATDVVNGNVSIVPLITPVEAWPTEGSVQTYPLGQEIYYLEDHENISSTGNAAWHDAQHGWVMADGDEIKIRVSQRAQVALNLCQYSGDDAKIAIYADGSDQPLEEFSSKAATDGDLHTYNYNGTLATTLTLRSTGTNYLHKATVYNVSQFIEKDAATGYYTLPAGDGAALILALNSASSEPGAKIFLPNGTYDLGQATGITVGGSNVSIIGESREQTIIVNAPPVEQEGLGSADLLLNTGTGLYMQDLTLRNALDYYAKDNGRAAALHDKGQQTVCHNICLDSHQDTYYSNKVAAQYYFNASELHGTVDYLCGDGDVFYQGCTLVNEKRNKANNGGNTMTAPSGRYVFNGCTVKNNDGVEATYNYGRAWSKSNAGKGPECVWIGTTLLTPDKLTTARWTPSGLNCDFSVAGEYGTKDANGQDITPATNVVTFQKENTQLETVFTAEQAGAYAIDKFFGDWAATAQQQTVQATMTTVTISADKRTATWSATDGTTYLVRVNGGEPRLTTDGTVTSTDDITTITVRAANARGGFGPAAETETAIRTLAAADTNNANAPRYNVAGQPVGKAYQGLAVAQGRKFNVK